VVWSGCGQSVDIIDERAAELAANDYVLKKGYDFRSIQI